MANLSDFNDPTRYNARTAQLNADQQAAQHQAQLSANQAAGSTKQTVVPVAKVATSQPLQNAQAVYGAQGSSTTATTSANVGDPMGSGTQTVTQTPPASPMLEGEQNRLAKRLADIDQKYANISATGNTVDAAAVQAEKQTAIAEDNAIQNKAAQDKSAAQQQQATDTANSTGVVTPPTTPQDAGIQAALGSLPAEFSFLGPLFQKQQDTINQAIGSNTEMAQQQQALIDSSFGSVAENIKSMQESMKESSSAIQGLIQEAQQSSEQALAVQKKAEQERAAWDNLQIQRQTSKQQAEQHQSMVAQIALAGGFGQDAGMAAVAASDASFEDRIATLRTEGSVQQMEIASKYSTLYAQNKQDYIGKTITNMQDLQMKLESLNQQGNQNTTAWASAQSGIMDKWWNNQTSLSKESAKNSLEMGKEISGIIQQEKQEKIDKESAALDKIDYLLKNYPRESVADAIKELSQDVTSFDVQTLIDNPSLEEIKRAEAARAKAKSSVSGGGGYASSFLPSGMQTPPKPEKSFDDYISDRISEMENDSSQSFSDEKRAKIMSDNAEEWEEQYNATYLAASQTAAATQARTDLVSQFGQPVVDAARSVMDGTYGGTNPVKTASSAFGVPENQVATALVKLRQTGDISDTSVLSPDQQKAWNGLKKPLENDPYYVTYKGAQLAIGRIEAALTQQNGLSDIAAINGFQNGIVDPNATVRSEDVALIQSAMSWADRVDLDYWYKKAVAGDKLPQSMREQMAQTARAITAAYERAYIDQTLTRYQQEVQQAGLPQSVLQQYGSPKSATTVDSSVSSFVDSLKF